MLYPVPVVALSIRLLAHILRDVSKQTVIAQQRMGRRPNTVVGLVGVIFLFAWTVCQAGEVESSGNDALLAVLCPDNELPRDTGRLGREVGDHRLLVEERVVGPCRTLVRAVGDSLRFLVKRD